MHREVRGRGGRPEFIWGIKKAFDLQISVKIEGNSWVSGRFPMIFVQVIAYF